MPPSLTKPISLAAISHQSPSAKLSMRSSSSRITLVGYVVALGLKTELIDGTTNNAKDLSWVDHLLAGFCMTRRSKLESVQTAVAIGLREPISREVRERRAKSR